MWNGDGVWGIGLCGNLEVIVGFVFDVGEELGSVGLIVIVVVDGANIVLFRFFNFLF